MAKIDFDPFFTPKMTRMEHAGGAGWPGAAPEMESRLPIPRLTQRAGGQDYVSSKQTPSNYCHESVCQIKACARRKDDSKPFTLAERTRDHILNTLAEKGLNTLASEEPGAGPMAPWRTGGGTIGDRLI